MVCADIWMACLAGSALGKIHFVRREGTKHMVPSNILQKKKKKNNNNKATSGNVTRVYAVFLWCQHHLFWFLKSSFVV